MADFCAQCGRKVVVAGDFCNSECALKGYKICRCGAILRRQPGEPTPNFRRRVTCSPACHDAQIVEVNRERRARAAARPHSYCAQCGRKMLAGSDFCSDACRDLGYRECVCGEVLRPFEREKTSHFRSRKYCSERCENRGTSENLKQRWHDPEQRARLMRGVRLHHDDPAYLQVMRVKTLARWRDPDRKAQLTSKRKPKS